jgi:alpha-galactosidase
LWDELGLGRLESRGLCVFSNGFQSWSPGWELAAGEVLPRVRLMPRLNTYIDRAELRREHAGLRLGRRGTVVSHHLIYFRQGELYLALVSTGAQGPPLSFYFHRASGELIIEAFCRGQLFEGGQLIGRVEVRAAEGYFAFQDALGALCSDRDAAGGRLGGWESWYNHYHRIDEGLILDNLGGLRRTSNFVRRYSLDQGERGIFQIDDGWERSIGDWVADGERFPSGMTALAGRIRDAGCTPGLWLAPFLVIRGSRLYREHPQWLLRDSRGQPVVAGYQPRWGGSFYLLDLSEPAVHEFLGSTMERVVSRWGFAFLKLDFLYAGMLPGRFRKGGAAHQWYAEATRILTAIERLPGGEPVRYLGCGAPLLGCGDPFTLMRIGADTLERWDDGRLRLLGYPGRPSAWINLRDTLGRAFLDGTLYRNDPDVMFFRRRNIRLQPREKELIALAGFLFGSLHMISDDLHCLDEEESHFTDRCLKLFAALEGRRFAAQRLARDVYRLFDRRGEIAGVVNLRSRTYVSSAERARFNPSAGEVLLLNCSRRGSCLRFRPRSASLIRRRP